MTRRRCARCSGSVRTPRPRCYRCRVAVGEVEPLPQVIPPSPLAHGCYIMGTDTQWHRLPTAKEQTP